MSGPEFFQTGYGKRFFDGQLPQLIKGIEDLGKAVNRACDMLDNDFKLTSVTVDGEKVGDFVDKRCMKLIDGLIEEVRKQGDN